MTRPATRRARQARRVIFLALLLVPIVEIAAIVGVGKVIGGWPTFALLVVESLLGAWLVRHEGARAWRALNDALQTGRMPSRELADAALILIGGTLLLTPGFVTDLVGFVFILPFTRPLVRPLLERAVRSRILAATPVSRAGGETVEGTVIDG
jgi:UPF0716 protein FxsA